MTSLSKCRESRSFIILVVFLAMFFDKMLLTVVVPIIPNVLMGPEVEISMCENRSAKRSINAEHNGSIFDNYSVINTMDIQNDVENYTCRINHSLSDRNSYAGIKIGVLFASKAMVQVIVNPFVGMIINRIGYSVPMFTGVVVIFFSTIMFAFGTSYPVLLTARAVQGIGSSCSSVGGLSAIADIFKEDEERGEAMGIVIVGLALGMLAGPPFGGIMYQFFGKEITFLVLAGFILINGVLQILGLRPSLKTEKMDELSLIQLLGDRYILIIAGLVFSPAVIAYAMGSKFFGRFAFKAGRWLIGLLGMFVNSISLIVFPFATTFWHLIFPMACLGISAGMVDSSLIPYLGYLVDIRHTAIYGTVYAIADMSLAVGFSIGPTVSGIIVDTIGFHWLMWTFAILSALYSPLLLFIRDPPPKCDDEVKILQENSTSYLTCNQQNIQSGEALK